MVGAIYLHSECSVLSFCSSLRVNGDRFFSIDRSILRRSPIYDSSNLLLGRLRYAELKTWCAGQEEPVHS